MRVRGRVVPVDRELAADLAANLAALYDGAEQDIVAEIAARARDAVDHPEQQASLLARLVAWVRRILGRINRQVGPSVQEALAEAFRRGGREALAEVAELLGVDRDRVRRLRENEPASAALLRLIDTLTTGLGGTHLRVLRWTQDTYRAVVAASAASVLTGSQTRLQASQAAFDRLVDQGVTGFRDASGRNWSLQSYVEMAVRTATAQAAVQGHLDQLGQLGVDLVVVSDVQGECALCRPWEGRVLARSGVAGARTVDVEHATIDGRMVPVKVAGSVAEAVEAGLLHPGCRHSLSSYTPGITKLPTSTADPQGEKDRNRLRVLERHVRHWKLREAAALDDTARLLARRKVNAWQQEIRAHTARTGLNRQSAREQVQKRSQTPRAAVRVTQRPRAAS